MEIKRNMLEELFNEGNVTKEVEIDVRGTMQKFTIKPMGVVAQMRLVALANVETKDSESVAEHNAVVGEEMLDIVAEHTVEFCKLTNDEVYDIGAKDKYELVEKALGLAGVAALRREIIFFSAEVQKSSEKIAEETAEIVKN